MCLQREKYNLGNFSFLKSSSGIASSCPAVVSQSGVVVSFESLIPETQKILEVLKEGE